MPELTEADFAWWDAAGGDLTPVWDQINPADVEKIVAWARLNYTGIGQIKSDVTRIGTIALQAKAILQDGTKDDLVRLSECLQKLAEA